MHIDLAKEFEAWVAEEPGFEVLAPVILNVVCFRYHPGDRQYTEEELESINKELMDRLNRSGKLYLTHTKLKGKFSLRLSIGQTNTKREHVENAWERIKSTAKKVK